MHTRFVNSPFALIMSCDSQEAISYAVYLGISQDLPSQPTRVLPHGDSRSTLGVPIAERRAMTHRSRKGSPICTVLDQAMRSRSILGSNFLRVLEEANLSELQRTYLRAPEPDAKSCPLTQLSELITLTTPAHLPATPKLHVRFCPQLKMAVRLWLL